MLERPRRRLGQCAPRWVFTAQPIGSPQGQSIGWREVAIVASGPFVHLTVDFYINVWGSFFLEMLALAKLCAKLTPRVFSQL